jgi:hypothetical protein
MDRQEPLPADEVLENIAVAMERMDTDITTRSASKRTRRAGEHDPDASDGPSLAVHVVNIAMRIMSARYPAELA